MLINFWYALARSEELGEQPLKTRALDSVIQKIHPRDGFFMTGTVP
jgi:hypothetical protein